MIKKATYVILPILFSVFVISCNQNNDDDTIPDDTSGTYTDTRDGKTYDWVKIGNQVWMAENLAYQTAQNSWAYNNDANNVSQYGYLYSWSAAQTAAPEGWHIATDAEWKELQMFLGLSQTQANETGWYGTQATQLKSILGWDDNGGGTDEFGFNALPAGYYLGSGAFDHLGHAGYWWTATEDTPFSTSYAWLRKMSTNNAAVYRGHNDKSYGYSVRCVRD